ncbi:hypothetical protein A6E13_16555 [Aliivibrio fischeri]|uniref:hypothetical protein n=1 Tax=Aliivibrio fischeri TaxID=668 RepID=UPI00080E47FB|nr:hypothetical protein [Aliivibrio fischeri]OCH31832.1 hypothetical protein A6E13_16555 [Aliivibrio fischeri]
MSRWARAQSRLDRALFGERGVGQPATIAGIEVSVIVNEGEMVFDGAVQGNRRTITLTKADAKSAGLTPSRGQVVVVPGEHIESRIGHPPISEHGVYVLVLE